MRAAAIFLVLVQAASALAQAPSTPEARPGDTRPALPQLPDRAPGIQFQLPPAPAAAPPRRAPAPRAFVREIRFSGNQAISTEELREVARTYENREVSTQEFQELRNALTLLYVNKGYINSGALLPDQEVASGVVTYQIVEGALNTISVQGAEWLKPWYLESRIRRAAGPPLNINTLQERLQLFEQDGLLERINAELTPGVRPGESDLKVAVKEARPYQIGIAASNRRPPSVGAYLGEVFVHHRNLLGFADSFEARFGITDGANEYLLGYSVPVTPWDTLLSFRATKTGSSVVEAPFNDLDIKSTSRTYQAGVTQPVYRTLRDTVSIGLRYERRDSDTRLLGVPFSFSVGVPDGKSEVDVWRASLDWTQRTASTAVALRITGSHGTTNALPQVGGIGPTTSFYALLAQYQLAQRFARGDELFFRADIQGTGYPLMSIEKIAIGGMNTVRGYRENQLLRDRATIASVEYRFLLTAPDSSTRVFLGPFYDFGRGTNADRTNAQPLDISSAGVGLTGDWKNRLHWQLYLAHAFRNIPHTKYNLQDSGIHFALTYLLF